MKVRIRVGNVFDEDGPCNVVAMLDLQHLPVPAIGTQVVLNMTSVRVNEVVYELLGGENEVTLYASVFDPIAPQETRFKAEELIHQLELIDDIASEIQID